MNHKIECVLVDIDKSVGHSGHEVKSTHMAEAETEHEQRQRGDNDPGHGEPEAHLRLIDSVVLFRQANDVEIRERASVDATKDTAYERCQVHKSDPGGGEVVRRIRQICFRVSRPRIKGTLEADSGGANVWEK